MKLKIKQLLPDAKMPTYGTPGSACFDLYSIESGWVNPDSPGIFDTGLAVEIPEGHVMLVYSRSGHGFKNDIRLGNGTGIIDCDYRGPLKVKLTQDSNQNFEGDQSYRVEKGERIAQAMVTPIEQCEFEWVDELSDTERGAGGMQSTGKM